MRYTDISYLGNFHIACCRNRLMLENGDCGVELNGCTAILDSVDVQDIFRRTGVFC